MNSYDIFTYSYTQVLKSLLQSWSVFEFEVNTEKLSSFTNIPKKQASTTKVFKGSAYNWDIITFEYGDLFCLVKK